MYVHVLLEAKNGRVTAVLSGFPSPKKKLFNIQPSLAEKLRERYNLILFGNKYMQQAYTQQAELIFSNPYSLQRL